MKKIITASLLFLIVISARAQNLVPNGSFEQYSGCPTYYTQIDCVLFWMNVAQWPGPGGSPDYYNVCAQPASLVDVPGNAFGYQFPYSGDGYCGIITWDMNTLFREYIEVQLTAPLVQDSCYEFKMFVNFANKYKYAADAIGVYFTATPITNVANFLPLPYTPQINSTTGFISDTLNWVPVTGTYTALGGEQYIIIGNFKDDASTNFLFTNSAGVYDQSYIFMDEISLTATCPPVSVHEFDANTGMYIYPNPAGEYINIKIPGIKNTGYLNITDISGRKMLQRNMDAENLFIDTKNFAVGIYFIELVNKNIVYREKFLKE